MTAENKISSIPDHKDQFKHDITSNGIEDASTLMKGYAIAHELHSGQFRASGEPYHTHPVATVQLLIKSGVRDTNILMGGLLHDVIEDAPSFNGVPFTNNADWTLIATNYLIDQGISPVVIDLVDCLTKPKIDGVTIKTEDDRRKEYMKKLRTAPPEALLIKMADRLHNLQTLDGLDTKKADLVVSETQSVLFSVFTRVLTTFPCEGRYLFNQMSDAIELYEQSHHAKQTA